MFNQIQADIYDFVNMHYLCFLNDQRPSRDFKCFTIEWMRCIIGILPRLNPVGAKEIMISK